MNDDLLPIGDADWPDVLADMRDGFAGKLNVYRVMAHNPPLLRAWTALRQHVVIDSALTEQQKEMVILRTGHRWRSRYEWAHHVYRGSKGGLSDFRIARAAMDADDWGAIDDEDVMLLRATDVLLDDGRLPKALRIQLGRFLSDAAIIDIMATIGMYTTLAFLVNSFDTPIDDDVRAFVSERA